MGMHKNLPFLLILGFGDIARRLVQLRIAASSPAQTQGALIAVGRRQQEYSGVTCLALDAAGPELERALDFNPENILITLTPDNYNEDGYRRSYLNVCANLCQQLRQKKQSPNVYFVSSTSVYGENSGGWVDETTDCGPTRYSGRVLLEAEQLLLNSEFETSIIRFSGIYGPGRNRLIERCRKGLLASPQPVHWSNRIHADDCAAVINHLLKLPVASRKRIYLASDCYPSPIFDVQSWISQRMGLQQMPIIGSNNEAHQTGKRCTNHLLLSSGFKFQYPGYQQGYAELLER